MKYVIFTIILLTVISLFITRRITENFQGTSTASEGNITTQALSDLLSNININNNLIDSNNPISFDNLNINSISNELLESIESRLNLDISNIDKEEINEMGIDTSKRYKLDSDIKKLKLINEELKRRRLERKNKYHLMAVKDKLDRLQNYDNNDKMAIYSTCPQEPFPYDQVGSEYGKYNLNITRHPIKWYGLQSTPLTNKLPYNFYVH